MSEGPKVVSVKEIAEFLKITEETVYNLAKKGKIPGIKVGNQWRFDMEEIQKMFKQGIHDDEIKKERELLNK